MYGANPFISSVKGTTPAMVTTSFLLKLYLKKSEKAHAILNFIYDVKKRKEILKRIRDILLSSYKDNSDMMSAIYLAFKSDKCPAINRRMNFLEIIKAAQFRLNEL